jgi:hypothetical protein
MGVWHISGLGMSPGAFTVPTTAIYLLLKAAKEGVPAGREFFETSGERTQEAGTLRGFPEGFVIFTSKEILEKKVARHSGIKDRWFGNNGKEISVPRVTYKFIRDLHGEFFSDYEIPEIYYLAVDHRDFKKALPLIYNTVNALGTKGGKELWANMVGGTNQINASILTAGSLSGAISRYYYYFEQDNDLLHPDLEKPRGISLKGQIDQILSKWFQLPIFDLGWGDISTKIDQLMEQYNNMVPLSILKEELKMTGMENQYLAKLTGSRLIVIENNLVKPGADLNQLKSLLSIDSESPDNSSKWVKWAAEKGILWQQERDKDCNLKKVSI